MTSLHAMGVVPVAVSIGLTCAGWGSGPRMPVPPGSMGG